MHLLEFPNELLLRIANFLDVESLAVFGKIDQRLEDISLNALQIMTVKHPNEGVLEYLREKGSWIRSMDLSNSKLKSGRLFECVKDCPNLRELNVVNSELPHQDLLRVLRFLDKLEVLSFSMEPFDEDDELVFEESGPLGSIKKIYVETVLTLSSCSVIVNFLNNCEAIENVHVNFLGHTHRLDLSLLVVVPELKADRWRTLHTFVCSCWMANHGSGLHKVLLRNIFAHKSSPECTRWIDENKDCYIYERGYFNGIAPKDDPKDALQAVDLIRRYQTVEISGTFKTPWGLPWSLRVLGEPDWATELNRINLLETLSSNLGELDLCGCHGGYTDEFRLSVLTSAPCLEVLMLPVCFFARPNKEDDTSSTEMNSARNEGCEALTEAMRKSKLRKFVLRGNHGVLPSQGCQECLAAVTSDNFVDLSKLRHLDELTFSDVSIDNSALEKMYSRNLRTLRLEFRNEQNFSSLPGFVRLCPTLENFRLSSFKSTDDLDLVIETIVAISNLKRLCLEPGDSLPAPRLLERLAELPQGLEILHYHLTGDRGFEHPFTEEVYEALRNLSDARGKKISFIDDPFSLRFIRCFEVSQSTPERCLCALDNSVGSVKLVGWEMA